MAIEFEQRPPTPSIENQYLALLRKIDTFGSESDNRTGIGTKKLYGETLKADLSQGFPLLTTKRIPFRLISEELLWFIRGERNVRSLVQENVHIWDEWPFQHYLKANDLETTYPKYTEGWENQKKIFIEKIKESEEFANQWGDLGPVYGYQWRHWKNPDGTEIDQLANAIELIKNNPDSRRIIVTAWNPSDIPAMSISGLPPCHMTFQFQVDQEKLNLTMYQRSVDSFLGLPFNIASYALLNHIVANITGKVPGELTLFLADTHVYKTHQEAVKTQLSRIPGTLPKLKIDGKFESIDEIVKSKIQLESYFPHPTISAPIAV